VIDTSTGRRPEGGALALVADLSLGIWGSIGSGVCFLRIACLLLRRSLRLGPGRYGMEITSLGRDARGLTFSVVIPARVMQPEVSTRGKQNWRLALCCYGMTFAPRHRVHRMCVASLAHLCNAHRLGCSLAGLWWRVRVGLAPGASHQVQNTPLCSWRWPAGVPVSVPTETPDSAMLFRRPPLLGEAAAPAVLCAGRMDLRTAASARQPESCSGHPCELTR
jgi:hypothetical protein